MMSTRTLGRWGAAALIAAAAGFASPAVAEDVTLRITLQLPLKSHLGQNLVLFKDKVEELSGGEIEVEIYDSAQLYRDKDVPEAVGSGQIEMGVASLTRYVGEIPAVDHIFDARFGVPDDDAVPGIHYRQ